VELRKRSEVGNGGEGRRTLGVVCCGWGADLEQGIGAPDEHTSEEGEADWVFKGHRGSRVKGKDNEGGWGLQNN